jgi:phosphoglycerate dehydrogenase-like enzyme
MAELTALVNRGLPAPTDLDPAAVQGQDLVGTMPSMLNRLVPPKTRPRRGFVGWPSPTVPRRRAVPTRRSPSSSLINSVMPTVLIGPSPLRHQPGAFRRIFEAAGFTMIDPEGNDTLSEAQLRGYLPEAEAVVAGGEPITAELLRIAPRLRVIARTGVGYDAIDLAAASARGVVVTITPGTNHDSVAEQAFALLLALARRVAVNDRIIRDGGWDRTLVRPLRGQTLGLVGLGRIGRAMVPKALAFGMRVVAYDPLPPSAFDEAHGLLRLDLGDLLAEADVVSLHLPLNEATRGLFHRGTFARMRPGALLINTARGGLVVEPDLYESLTSGHLAGAGLDVLGCEPPEPGNPLLRLPNVVLSPHIAGIDTRAMADMADLAARCIVDLIRASGPRRASSMPRSPTAGGGKGSPAVSGPLSPRERVRAPSPASET